LAFEPGCDLRRRCRDLVADHESAITAQGARPIIPRAYRTFALDQAALSARLLAAPLEHSAAAARATVLLPLPLPDGTFGRFAIKESPIMEPGLAAQFPEIKTFLGQGSMTRRRQCGSTGRRLGSTR